jgi:outer membrane protein TolC
LLRRSFVLCAALTALAPALPAVSAETRLIVARPAVARPPVTVARPPVASPAVAGPSVTSLPEVAPAAPGARSLSLIECLRLVVSENPDVVSDRLNANIGDLDYDAARHRFGLFLDAGPEIKRSVRPTAETVVSGGVSQLQELGQTYKLGLRQDLTTGGNVGLQFQNGITDTNSQGVTINPAYAPTASFYFSQPLLRNAMGGFKDVAIARLGAEQSHLHVRERLLKTVADAEVAYWQLVASRKGLAVREQSLVLVKDLVRIDEEKAKAGLLAKLDVLQARASLAVRESELLSARRDLLKAGDRLRALIDPDLVAEAWNAGIEPADAPTFAPHATAFEAAWEVAQAHRPDLAVNALERDRTNTQLDLASNHLWPTLDLHGGAGVNNLEGTQSGAVTNLATLHNYDLRAGMSLSMPLGHTTEQDLYAQAKLHLTQAELGLQSTRLRAYAEVRDAVRDVDIDAQRVAATKLARELADAKLDAEQAKLKAGLSTNFEVLKFQDDFQQASLQEVQATIEYLQAQTRLEQFQGTLLAARGLEVVEIPDPGPRR